MARGGHLLERLLAKVEARDLVLARGENTFLQPRVFARLVMPYSSSTPHYLETKQTNDFALIFPISWDLLKKEKRAGLKKVTDDDIAFLQRGWYYLSVGLRSQRFQEHIIERMLEAANGLEIFVKQNRYSSESVFLPRASCVKEVKIWLDLNEISDDRDKNLRNRNLRKLIKNRIHEKLDAQIV